MFDGERPPPCSRTAYPEALHLRGLPFHVRELSTNRAEETEIGADGTMGKTSQGYEQEVRCEVIWMVKQRVEGYMGERKTTQL